jgi:hypothetical protein
MSRRIQKVCLRVYTGVNTERFPMNPCGGGLEYLHRSPVSRKKRRKGNLVPGRYTLATLFLADINTGTWPSRLGESQMRQYIWSGFCGTCAPEWLLWQGPKAIVRVNYRPILSSERAPHSKKPTIVKKKKKIWSWAPDGSPTPKQTGRLFVGGYGVPYLATAWLQARCPLQCAPRYVCVTIYYYHICEWFWRSLTAECICTACK